MKMIFGFASSWVLKGSWRLLCPQPTHMINASASNAARFFFPASLRLHSGANAMFMLRMLGVFAPALCAAGDSRPAQPFALFFISPSQQLRTCFAALTLLRLLFLCLTASGWHVRRKHTKPGQCRPSALPASG